MNKLQENSVKKINSTGSNFKLMENVEAFQKAAKAYGLPGEEIFQTVDLFEARNIAQVTLSLYALGRIVRFSYVHMFYHFFSTPFTHTDSVTSRVERPDPGTKDGR